MSALTHIVEGKHESIVKYVLGLDEALGLRIGVKLRSDSPDTCVGCLTRLNLAVVDWMTLFRRLKQTAMTVSINPGL